MDVLGYVAKKALGSLTESSADYVFDNTIGKTRAALPFLLISILVILGGMAAIVIWFLKEAGAM